MRLGQGKQGYIGPFHTTVTVHCHVYPISQSPDQVYAVEVVESRAIVKAQQWDPRS